jgi:hypothetical protein
MLAQVAGVGETERNYCPVMQRAARPSAGGPYRARSPIPLQAGHAFAAAMWPVQKMMPRMP